MESRVINPRFQVHAPRTEIVGWRACCSCQGVGFLNFLEKPSATTDQQQQAEIINWLSVTGTIFKLHVIEQITGRAHGALYTKEAAKYFKPQRVAAEVSS